MINSIIEAIAIALNGEFGDEYKTYTEEQKQGLTEPCFFISCINPTHELFFWKRYKRENMFVIQYFPEDHEQERLECNAVAERLYSALEWITVKYDSETGDPVMGTKMHYSIEDGILSFFVNYNLFVRKELGGDPMEDLTINQIEKAVN